jgi:DNA-binding transcriptional ArsR family regulator
MSRWFRVHDELVDDPKIQRLPGETVKALLNLWCLTSQNGGLLPAAGDIAFKLRMTPAKVAKLLSVLGECGLIDSDEDGLRPHNWNVRQYKSDVTDPTAAARQKAYRDRNKNRDANRNDTVTVTDTRAETDNRTEKKERTRAVALDDDWPDDFGDQFWQAYPRKTEKLAAMKKLAMVRKSRIVSFADIMAGVKRYAAANIDPQFTKHPTTWLNAGCWADETQPGATNGKRTHDQARRSSSADFFAGIASVAADITGNSPASGLADEEIPLGRFNIDG